MPKILIIEDSPTQAVLLKAMVEEVSPELRVDVASDLKTAEYLIKRTDYSSICLDLNIANPTIQSTVHGLPSDSAGAISYLTIRSMTGGNIVVFSGDKKEVSKVKPLLKHHDLAIIKPQGDYPAEYIVIQLVAGAYVEAS